jgi:hypothetical protein
MALTERRRLLKSGDFSCVKNNLVEYQGVVYLDSKEVFPLNLYAWQITRSDGTRWPEGRAERDVGGPFETIRSWYSVAHEQRIFDAEVFEGLFYHGKYHGRLLFEPGAVIIPGVWAVAEPTLDQLAYEASKFSFGSDIQVLGSKMISSSIPTNPVVDGSVALAELFREGIPSMIGSSLLKARSGFLRDLGSEYLNFEFGWKPLVADVKNAAKAIVESEMILKQLVRDSGRNVRRRRHLLPTKEVETLDNNVGQPRGILDPRFFEPSWTRQTDTYRRDTWFSGCYTFEYDPGNLSEISKIATQARVLYGLQLNPEVLWNLAPWSWLVDWFANVGPLLHNVSAFQNDQLVLRYGYVMDRHQRSHTTVADIKPINGNTLPDKYKQTFQLDWKRRVQATPYGFGVASSSFTIRQWAILAALGITRAPQNP